MSDSCRSEPGPHRIRASSRRTSSRRTRPYGAPFMPVHSAPPRAPSGLATAALVVGGLWILVQVGCVVTVWPAVDEYSRASSLGIDAADVWTTYDTVNLLVLPFALATYDRLLRVAPLRTQGGLR